LRTGDKIAGMKFHMVTCIYINIYCLKELKKAHKIRHHTYTVTTKGFAQYELFRTTSLEDTFIESESNIYVYIAWNTVDKILQIPPLSSAATLNTILAPVDPRSPVYQLHGEFQFLLVLSEGLKTGISDWPEPIETKTAVKLVRELLDDLKNKLYGFDTSVNRNETEGGQYDVSCFIGQELATLTYLDYFIDTSVDLQEQVHRIQKLHHMLEIVVSCRLLLKFKHENLFPLTQSCIKYYKENPLNEKHVFQLPIWPTLIWRVEISTEHMTSSSLDLARDTTICCNSEERMYFITMANCSQVSFT
uniref:Protein zwilch n=1 Tax=Sphenodon punctatus TaxID=8508 RepID=A0A8D0GQQ5_SPHPU